MLPEFLFARRILMSDPSIEATTEKNMKSKLFGWLKDIIIVVVIVSAVLAWQGRNLLEDDGSIQVSEQNFVTLAGDSYALTKTDKKTVMYFFAPWCSICRYSIGNLDVIDTNEYNVIRVALDYQSQEEVQAFVDGVGIDEPILLGASNLKTDFNISGYPTYYVLDQDLNVIANDMGYSSTLGIKLRTSF